MKDRNSQPTRKLKLQYTKLKCFHCQVIIDYKIYIKEFKCNLYQTSKEHNNTIIYTKNWEYDT